MNYKDSILNFIKENFLFGEEIEIDDKSSFLDSGILDSTGVLELVNFLEETYEISIEDDELIPENLDSLENIANFLQQKTVNV